MNQSVRTHGNAFESPLKVNGSFKDHARHL